MERGVEVIGAAGEGAGLPAVARRHPDDVRRRWVDRVRALAPNGVDAALDIAGAASSQTWWSPRDGTKVISIADFGPLSRRQGVHVAQNPARAYAEAARLNAAGSLSIAGDGPSAWRRPARRSGPRGGPHARTLVVVVG